MTDASDPAQPRKKLRAADLIPAKKAVPVSFGTLYVRHTAADDHTAFNAAEPGERNRLLVMRLAGHLESKMDPSGLSGHEFDALTPDERDALARAAAEVDRWPNADQVTFSKFSSLFEERARERRAIETDQLAKYQQSLAGYNFLDKSTFDALHEQFGRYDRLRESFLQATQPVSEAVERMLKDVQSVQAPALDALLKEEPRFALPDIPRPENTTLGKAQLRSEQHLRAVLDKVEAVSAIGAELNSTMLERVLPQWFDHVLRGQKQASRALWAAIVTLVLSIAVTFGVAWWQVDVARSIDETNSKSQQAVERLLHEQLAVQKQTAADAARAALVRDQKALGPEKKASAP